MIEEAILASIINLLLDVVLNLQDVCLPRATFLLRRFYFYIAPHHLSFLYQTKILWRKSLKKLQSLALFYPSVDILERPVKRRSYFMMLPNYAFYFPLFGALDTFFGARHYCMTMSNVMMKRMKYVKTAYISLLCGC